MKPAVWNLDYESNGNTNNIKNTPLYMFNHTVDGVIDIVWTLLIQTLCVYPS